MTYENNAKHLYDNLYLTSGNDVPWAHEVCENELISLLESLGLESEDNILDAGCGYSRFAKWAVKEQLNYSGIDISSIPITQNISMFGSEQVQFFTTSIQDFQGVNKYACIIDIGCLHCIPHDEQSVVIEKYISMLQDGASLILRFFNNPAGTGSLFEIQGGISIFGCKEQELVKRLTNYGKITYKFINSTQFDLTDRITLVLQKAT